MDFGDIFPKELRSGPKTDIWRLIFKISISAESDHKIRGFSLRLGDGSRWWVAGSPRASFLAEKLAAIMQLNEGDPKDSHLIFFYDKYADRPHLELPLLEAQGWRDLHYFFSQTYYHPGLHHVLMEYDAKNPHITPHYLMAVAMTSVHGESICRGGVPFHAALLENQGQRVILAAPGNTGKSTCSRRVPPPWYARCDDEVLVVLSPEGSYLAHCFPTWTDYLCNRNENTWKVEDAVPLAGIFFIEQADEDDCLPLENAQAAVAVVGSARQIMDKLLKWCDAKKARELRRTIFNNAFELVKQVPAFRLQVSLTGRFWEKIEAALGWCKSTSSESCDTA